MAFGPDLDGKITLCELALTFDEISNLKLTYDGHNADVQSISSDEYLLSPKNTAKENDTSCGIMNGLFDGANDSRHHGRDIHFCEYCAREEREARRESHNRRQCHRPSIKCRNSRRHHQNPDRSEPVCRVHWEDRPQAEQSDWENGWESYDTESTASSDYVCRGYQYYPSSKPTDPISRHKVEDYKNPHSCIRESQFKPKGCLSQRPKQDQSSGWKIWKASAKTPSAKPKPCQNLLLEEVHSGNHGCAPSVVLNINSTQPTQEVKPEINHTCHQCADTKCCAKDDTTDDGCYIVSNNKRVRRCCRHHIQSQHHCMHGGGKEESNSNDNIISTNTDNDGGNDGGCNTSHDNQNNNGSSWDNNNDQGNSDWNRDNNDISAGWNEQDNQNNAKNNTWDQGQGNQQNDNTDDWDKGNSNLDFNAQGQQQSTSWDNGNESNGQNWMARGGTSGNGDAPPADNNHGQFVVMASPNNGYNNPQPGPSSPPQPPPPPPVIPVQAQGPIWGFPPSIQKVHTLITPYCQGQEASEPPLYTVPEQVAQERSLSHQVQVGRSSRYSHKIKVPQYLDTMEEPYAKFIFKYRVKGKCNTFSNDSPLDLLLTRA